jgi:hypothetical protein
MSASATTSDNKSGENNNSAKANVPSNISKLHLKEKNQHVILEDWNYDDADDDEDDDQEIGVNYNPNLKRNQDNTPKNPAAANTKI